MFRVILAIQHALIVGVKGQGLWGEAGGPVLVKCMLEHLEPQYVERVHNHLHKMATCLAGQSTCPKYYLKYISKPIKEKHTDLCLITDSSSSSFYSNNSTSRGRVQAHGTQSFVQADGVVSHETGFEEEEDEWIDGNNQNKRRRGQSKRRRGGENREGGDGIGGVLAGPLVAVSGQSNRSRVELDVVFQGKDLQAAEMERDLQMYACQVGTFYSCFGLHVGLVIG